MFAVLIIFYLIFVLIMLAIPVAAYVISAIGLSRMAKSCGLRSPYLAWIPVADMYLLGSIAEIGASRDGKKSLPFRKILPGLSAGVFAVLIAMLVALFALVFSEVAPTLPNDTENGPGQNVEYVSYSWSESEYEYDIDIDIGTDEELGDYNVVTEDFAAAMFLIIMLSYLLLFAIAIALSVFEYLALWHVFKLFDEQNAILYLVLSILVSVALPVIYFILGRKLPSDRAVSAEEAMLASSIRPEYTAPIAAMPMAPAPASPVEQTPVKSESDQQL